MSKKSFCSSISSAEKERRGKRWIGECSFADTLFYLPSLTFPIRRSLEEESFFPLLSPRPPTPLNDLYLSLLKASPPRCIAEWALTHATSSSHTHFRGIKSAPFEIFMSPPLFSSGATFYSPIRRFPLEIQKNIPANTWFCHNLFLKKKTCRGLPPERYVSRGQILGPAAAAVRTAHTHIRIRGRSPPEKRRVGRYPDRRRRPPPPPPPSSASSSSSSFRTINWRERPWKRRGGGGEGQSLLILPSSPRDCAQQDS